MPVDPQWWTVVLGVANFLVAMWIAINQSTQENRKHKKDLLDRRLAIYQAADKAIKEVLRSANVADETLGQYLEQFDLAHFLLTRDAVNYLTLLQQKMLCLRSTTFLLAEDRTMTGERRKAVAEEKRDLLLWFGQQRAVLKERLSSDISP
jgi:hypothetical protein